MVEYKYDAWGKPLGKTGSLASTLGTLNPFRYRGYVYDEETGLYYLRSRYYNPLWDRFVNADVLLGQVGALLGHNVFAYCCNNPVAMADNNGFAAVECESYFFKNTYCISGEEFYSYLLWQFDRHPNKRPDPPIIEAFEETVGILGGEIASELNEVMAVGGKIKDYMLPIVGPFFNFNYETEGYIVKEMTRNCCGPNGYQNVQVEILYGSHSAEVRLTLEDLKGNIITCNPIVTNGYEVILDMMECMKNIVEQNGGNYTHEHVGWKYSLCS